jgi:hypothetical protein
VIHAEQVADLDLGDVDQLFVAVADHAGLFCAELEQRTQGVAGAALGAGLEVAAQRQQRHDGGRDLEVEEPAGEQRDRGVAVGGQRPDPDQGVHVGGEPAGTADHLRGERPPDVELDRGGQRELGPARPLLFAELAREHRQPEHHQRRGGCDEHPAQPAVHRAGLGLLGLVPGFGGPTGLDQRGELVAQTVDRLLQLGDLDTRRVEGHQGPTGRVVHLGVGDAGVLGQGLLDPGRARPAGHALRGELDRSRVAGSGLDRGGGHGCTSWGGSCIGYPARVSALGRRGRGR